MATALEIVKPVATVKMARVVRPRARVDVTSHELSRAMRDPRLVMLTEPDGPRAGAFRLLHQRVAAQDDPRRILITSPRSGDGKTMCAINLAAAYAERGLCRPVVLEANLRRPQLAKLLDFEPAACFGRQLIEHRIDPSQQWTLVHIEPLDILVAAVDPRQTPRRVDPSLFAFALGQLQLAGFGPIIVDGPPILGGAEANLLLESCEGALLATRANHSRARDVQSAVDQLLPGQVFGVVLVDA